MLAEMPEIGVVVTLHREGLLAAATLASAFEAAEFARVKGKTVRLLAVLDQPDAVTRSVLESWRHGLDVLEVVSGDVGLNRNAAVAALSARFLTMLDGDDLWAPDWLVAAHTSACAGPPGAVWHPEANFYFGQRGSEHWFMHPDMESPGFDRASMELINPWTSLCFAPRELFMEVPYPASDLPRGFGYEDWHWNLATAARGALHKTVPGTVHLIRQKPVSLVRRTAASGALMVPLPRSSVIA
jgi:hypothetical protein